MERLTAKKKKKNCITAVVRTQTMRTTRRNAQHDADASVMEKVKLFKIITVDKTHTHTVIYGT